MSRAAGEFGINVLIVAPPSASIGEAPQSPQGRLVLQICVGEQRF